MSQGEDDGRDEGAGVEGAPVPDARTEREREVAAQIVRLTDKLNRVIARALADGLSVEVTTHMIREHGTSPTPLVTTIVSREIARYDR